MIAVAAALACTGAQAQTTIFDFGTQLTGSYQPLSSFATLSVTTTNSMNYLFDLQLTSDFGSLFNNANAFVGRVLFNTAGVDPIGSSVQLATGSWGVTKIKYNSSSAQPGAIDFDFSETLGQGANNRLVSGERVVWTTSFAQPTGFVAPQFALHVQSIGSNGDSGWYVPTVSPIPEPETYALMLAGLGLLGFHARRRKQKEAAAA
ncbi:MAG: PEP-CTERM sorting domain-containing protein [Betaproteobacteria bacterium]